MKTNEKDSSCGNGSLESKDRHSLKLCQCNKEFFELALESIEKNAETREKQQEPENQECNVTDNEFKDNKEFFELALECNEKNAETREKQQEPENLECNVTDDEF